MQADNLSRYVMSHLDQLSLVIPLWVGTILWSTACLEPYDSCKQLSHRRSQRGTWDLDPQGSRKKLHNRPSCATGTNIGLYVKDLCLVSLNVNVTKYYMPQKCQKWQICGYKVCFFQALNIPKLVFVRGSVPDPAGGPYNATRLGYQPSSRTQNSWLRLSA